MQPKRDYHIHTALSNCATKDMTVEAIVRECESLGLEEIGITDHLYDGDYKRNLPAHKEIGKLESSLRVRRGVEIGFDPNLGQHPVTAEDRRRFGLDYTIGSHHGAYVSEYNINKVIELQHEAHLKTCWQPEVDVLGHPWRFMYEEFRANNWPWFDTVTVVPKGLTRELGRVARETGTAIEINAHSSLRMKRNPPAYLEEYIGFLSILADEGVMFSTASDSHELGELQGIRLVYEVVDRLGLTDDRLWRPGLGLKKCAPKT